MRASTYYRIFEYLATGVMQGYYLIFGYRDDNETRGRPARQTLAVDIEVDERKTSVEAGRRRGSRQKIRIRREREMTDARKASREATTSPAEDAGRRRHVDAKESPARTLAVDDNVDEK